MNDFQSECSRDNSPSPEDWRTRVTLKNLPLKCSKKLQVQSLPDWTRCSMFPTTGKPTWGHRWSPSRDRTNLTASQTTRRFTLICTLPLEVARQQTPRTSTSSWGTRCWVTVMAHSSIWPWTPIRWMSKSGWLLLQVRVVNSWTFSKTALNCTVEEKN